MKDLYLKLFRDCSANLYRISGKMWSFREFGHFVAMAGKEYHKESVKLMVVGRATNGWYRLEADDENTFGTAVEKELAGQGFSWVVGSDAENGLMNGEGDYTLSSSAFWRTTKNIWRKLSGKESDRWVDHIAWSNLYKVAPRNDTEETRYDYANPSQTLCRKQLDACHKILQREVEEYKPTHLLFITGWDWLYDWASDFGRNDSAVFEGMRKQPPIGKHTYENGIFVEGAFNYRVKDHEVKVVVACRPERRPEQEFVDQVIGAFNGL